jgi:hypothetical protein
MRLGPYLFVLRALWQRARGYVSSGLVIVGLMAIAYGVVFWWKELPYRDIMLLACVALGSLPLGLGLSLRSPSGPATLALAAVCCALSGVLQLFVFSLTPFHPVGLALQVLAWGGAAQSYTRFRKSKIKVKTRKQP